MDPEQTKLKERIDFHKDGSIRAKGFTNANGTLEGYWEWYRLDGTKLRSGQFKNGEQAGEWVTYDKEEKPYKTTRFSA